MFARRRDMPTARGLWSRGILAVFMLFSVFGCERKGTGVAAHPTRIELGDIETDTIFRKRIFVSISNSGSQKVTVELVPNCGCIVSKRSVDLAAHSSEKVDVELSVAPNPGQFHKEIAVVSGNGDVHDIITLAGSVLPNARLSHVPSTINFGELVVGKSRSFKLFRFDGSPVQLQKLTYPDGFEYLVSQTPDESELRITLTYIGTSVPAAGDMKIGIETFNTHHKGTTIPILARSLHGAAWQGQ